MFRAIYAPGAEVLDINGPAPVNKGGTAATDKITAVGNLGGISRDLLNQANNAIELDEQGNIADKSIIPPGINAGGVTVIGPISLDVNEVGTYTITNYSSFITYNVSASVGSVSINGDTITYVAPSTAVDAGFTINNRFVNVVITNNVIYPLITSPVEGAIDLPSDVTLTSSAFKEPTSTGTWTTSGDITLSPGSISVILEGKGQTAVLNPAGSQATATCNMVVTGSELVGENVWQVVSNTRKVIMPTVHNSSLPTNLAVAPAAYIVIPPTVSFEVLPYKRLGTITRQSVYIQPAGTIIPDGDYTLTPQFMVGTGGSAVVTLVNNAITNIVLGSEMGLAITTALINIAPGGALNCSIGIDVNWDIPTEYSQVSIIASGGNMNASSPITVSWNSGSTTIETYQSSYQQTVYTYGVGSVTVNNGGFGYRQPPVIDLSTIGASANAAINANGVVTAITVINQGSTTSAASPYIGINGNRYGKGADTVVTIEGNQYVFPGTALDTAELVKHEVTFTNRNISKSITGNGFVNYAVYNIADNHASSDWQLSTAINFSSIAKSISDDTVNKTSWSVTDLYPNTTYYARVRYKGNTLGYSDWSDTRTFKTKENFYAYSEIAVINDPDNTIYGSFGQKHVLSGDGNIIATTSKKDCGKIYVYKRNNNDNTWTLQQTLMPVATENIRDGINPFSAEFTGISINSSGDRIAAIGVRYSADGSNYIASRLYVFKYTNNQWILEYNLVDNDLYRNGSTTEKVLQFTEDGNTLIASNFIQYQECKHGFILFKYTNSWNISHRVTDILPPAGYSYIMSFTRNSININPKGTKIIATSWVGNKTDGSESINFIPAIHIFDKITDTDWKESTIVGTYISIADGNPQSYLRITSDFKYILINNPYLGDSLCFYELTGDSANGYVLTSLSGKDIGGQSSSFIGNSSSLVSSSSAGSSQFLGLSKCVYLEKEDSVWVSKTEITPSDNFTGSTFGESCAISDDGKLLTVSAPYGDYNRITTTGSPIGRIYIFIR